LTVAVFLRSVRTTIASNPLAWMISVTCVILET
jgi:hypothetical protein